MSDNPFDEILKIMNEKDDGPPVVDTLEQIEERRDKKPTKERMEKARVRLAEVVEEDNEPVAIEPVNNSVKHDDLVVRGLTETLLLLTNNVTAIQGQLSALAKRTDISEDKKNAKTLTLNNKLAGANNKVTSQEGKITRRHVAIQKEHKREEQKEEREERKTRSAVHKLDKAMSGELIEFPHFNLGQDGLPAPTCRIENTIALLDHYKIGVMYNEMTKRVEIDIPEAKLIRDMRDNQALTLLNDLARTQNLPVTELQPHTDLLAEPYNPVRDWILSKPWDGHSRLDEFFDTVKSKHEMRDLLMLKWAIGAVHIIIDANGGKTEGTLVFDGEQGKGKTSWLKSLVPDPEWIKEGVSLDPRQKDTVIEALSAWITELGELGSTFRRSDLDILKGFLSKDRDHYRPAYAAKANEYPRRTAFFATTDSGAMLVDKGGNRRFWVIDVSDVDFKHSIDIQQLWAEMWDLHEQGYQHWLTPKELKELERHNQKFEVSDPVVDDLNTWQVTMFDPDSTNTEFRGNITAILKLMGYKNPTPVQLKNGGAFMKRAGFSFVNKNTREYHLNFLAPRPPSERQPAWKENLTKLRTV